MEELLKARPTDALRGDDADRLQMFFQFDAARHDFIEKMLTQIRDSNESIRKLEFELEDQKKSRLNFQMEADMLNKTVSSLEKVISKDPFVVVLVDGDGAKFADAFLRDPAQGAEKAAQGLKQAVQEQLKDTPLGHDDVTVLVRVYANLKSLAKALRLSHVIGRDDDMIDFAEKFTNSRSEFDFVNVGWGKENADSKIRRMLNFYSKNINCKKIFLAGICHDHGYLHDLRGYLGASEGRIVLVESTPAEAAFRTLGFPIVRFDGVFSSLELNNTTRHSIYGSNYTMPIRNGTSPQGMVSTVSPTLGFAKPASVPPPSSQPSSMPPPTDFMTGGGQTHQQLSSRTGSVIDSGNGGISRSYATAGGAASHQNIDVKPNKSKQEPKSIVYNYNGRRIDPPARHPGDIPAQVTYRDKVALVQPNVLCNDFYLNGDCGPKKECTKIHDVKLSPGEISIHRYKARTSVCPRGPDCEKYDCYLSHHCILDPYCNRPDCKFAKSRYGDLHLNSQEELTPHTKWIEGKAFPEQV